MQAETVEAMRVVEDADVVEVAGVLGHAMQTDPAWSYLFPRPDNRAKLLSDFFALHLRHHLPYRCSLFRRHEDTAAATVTIRAPGGIDIPARAFASGLSRLAWRSGPSTVTRLLRLKETYEDLERRTAGTERYWHVHMMAVQPELQGRGMGAELLREGLDAFRPDALIALTTHKERNVHFYRKAGFEVSLEEDVCLRGATPFRVWGMRRSPQ